jgi:homoserine kinase
VNHLVNHSTVVRVPASSANLGAGFDVLGMALELHLDIGSGDVPDDARPVDAHHPAAKAFAEWSSLVEPPEQLWVRSAIPMARGLGFSGAARVGGAALAAIGDTSDPAGALAAAWNSVLDVAVRMEGHGDNAAASVFGGVVAWVDGRVIPMRVGPVLTAASVVVWIPDTTTSTERSRSALADEVARADAVHNLGRIAQFVLAVEHDDPSLLAGATDDRLHQPIRLAGLAHAAEALDAGVVAGAWCGWLSGSGPTVAFLTDAALAETVAAALPVTGHVKQLRISERGVHVLATSERC